MFGWGDLDRISNNLRISKAKKNMTIWDPFKHFNEKSLQLYPKTRNNDFESTKQFSTMRDTNCAAPKPKGTTAQYPIESISNEGVAISTSTPQSTEFYMKSQQLSTLVMTKYQLLYHTTLSAKTNFTTGIQPVCTVTIHQMLTGLCSIDVILWSL